MNGRRKETPFQLVVDKKMSLLLRLLVKLHTVCDYELCFWLSKFVHEIREQDGTYYPPNTLYQICIGVQRYLRENGLEGLNIFQDSQYKAFQDSLDARMKNLTRSGLGITVKQAKPILEDEEEILWSKGLLGDSDPKILVNTLVFLFGKYFALRSGEEHRSLSFAQLEVVKGDETERSWLRYSSFGEKNFGGGLQHRRIKPKIVEQHENISNPERCIVRLTISILLSVPRICRKVIAFTCHPKAIVKLMTMCGLLSRL